MIKPRLIPCLDVRDGRVVKGVRFQNLRDSGDPATLAQAYEDDGADEIVMLDVSATVEGRNACHDTVRRLRKVLSIPLTVGGGVRQVHDAAALLHEGADKIAVNTAAVLDPELVGVLSERFGRQCVVVAVDAASRTDGSSRWEVIIRSGKERTGIGVVDYVKRIESLGAGEILLTSLDRDGTQSGYDLHLLAAVASIVHIPVVASGGASKPEDMADALRPVSLRERTGLVGGGADAVLAASILHDARWTIHAIKQRLRELGFDMRDLPAHPLQPLFRNSNTP